MPNLSRLMLIVRSFTLPVIVRQPCRFSVALQKMSSGGQLWACILRIDEALRIFFGIKSLAITVVLSMDGLPVFDPGADFWEAVLDGTFQWDWIVEGYHSATLPPLTTSGAWSLPNCTAPASTKAQTIGTVLPSPESKCSVRLDFRVLQYNCLTLKGAAATQLMAKTLESHRLPLAFFQETRSQMFGISEEGPFGDSVPLPKALAWRVARFGTSLSAAPPRHNEPFTPSQDCSLYSPRLPD